MERTSIGIILNGVTGRMGYRQHLVRSLLAWATLFGHVSLETEAYIAELFGMAPSHVHEVVTFYTLFFQTQPGRHVVSVCHNLSCHLAGAQDILTHLKARLGVEVGETTDDGKVTLLAVECLCACEAAPMMQVDERYELNLTREKVDAILGALS